MQNTPNANKSMSTDMTQFMGHSLLGTSFETPILFYLGTDIGLTTLLGCESLNLLVQIYRSEGGHETSRSLL